MQKSYSTSMGKISHVINITRNKDSPVLYNSLMSTLYSDPRKPDTGYFFDNSKHSFRINESD